jgi:putative ABC transport system permease protein
MNEIIMLGNLFKFGLCTLWRNRFSTVLQIVGLSIGISAMWVVWQFSSFELNHDREIPQG